MANPAVVVDFVANTKDLQRGFQQASGKASGFGSKLKGIATAGALAGFAALTASLKVGVEEFAEAQKVGAQTNSVLKSTGKQAGVTADQVGDLAESIMKKTGIDDEAIQSGENLLLTFTNIRNEAGKGNDIFNQATQTMTDMSVALGQDMKSSSVQLGKALNDPIKGITALTRVGVSFTEGQKKQITAMVEAGNTMGAQKLILGELNKEFGGSANAAGKTLPGQLNILKQEFSNLMGEIVTKVVPVLLQVIKVLNDNRTTVLVVGGAIAALTVGVLAVNAAMAAWAAIQAVVTVATKAQVVASKLLNAAMIPVPILLVIAALTALVGVFVLAYKHSETFRRIVDGAFDAVKKAAQAAINWIRQNWPLLLAILTGPFGLAVLAIVKHWDKIKEGARDAVGTIKDIWHGMVDWLSGMVDRIGNVATRVANAIKAPINAVIGLWNNLGIPQVSIPIPSISVFGKKLGGGTIGFGPFPFPDIPKLAKGGIVTSPTLAMIGEAGPEAVLPLGAAAGGGIDVHVYIGDTELRGLVRTEIVDSNTGIARTLLTGGAVNR